MRILKCFNKKKFNNSIGQKDEVAVCTNAGCDCTCGFFDPYKTKDRREILRALQGVHGGKSISASQSDITCVIN